jgi:tungstate transport system substrate-binding protein
VKNRVTAMCLLALAANAPAQVAAPGPDAKPEPAARVVRVAVIGGMMMTGLWPAVAKMFEAETGYRTEATVTGQRPMLAEALRAGRVDLLTMHSGDITTDLMADGFAINMRPWTRNEMCIVGPVADPAHIRGMTGGAVALKKIRDAGAGFVDFQGGGSREVVSALWEQAGITPRGPWLLKDESDKFDIMQYARMHNAYVVVGAIPAHTGRLYSEGMEILVQGDPAMRRAFMVVEANPAKLPNINSAGARALANFLVSDKVQKFLPLFGQHADTGDAMFFPVATGR